MTSRLPDLRLLRAFGNEEVLLSKVAGAESLAARVAVGLMEANRSLDHRRREEVLEAQAARMNHAFRMMEDRMMAPTREGMRHTRMPMILMALSGAHGSDGMGLGAPLQGVPRQLMGEDVPLGMDEGMVRMASAIGQELADHALEKDAGIGQVIGSLGKSLKPAVSGLGQSLSKGLSGAGKGIQSALQAPKGLGQGAGQTGSSFFQGMKNKLQGALGGGNAGGKNPFLSPPPAAHNPFGAQVGAEMRQSAIQQGKAMGKVQAPAAPASVGGKVDPARTVKQSPVAATQSGNRATTQAQPAPAGAAGKVQPPAEAGAPTGEGGFDLQKAWDRTGLSNGRYKYKLPLLAAGAAGAYGLYAGAKKGFEMLGREPAPAQYNAGGAVPAYGVNQYGVPDRSTPFM